MAGFSSLVSLMGTAIRGIPMAGRLADLVDGKESLNFRRVELKTLTAGKQPTSTLGDRIILEHSLHGALCSYPCYLKMATLHGF
jgi:hypothetical protein